MSDVSASVNYGTFGQLCRTIYKKWPYIYMIIQFLCTIFISLLVANLIKKRIPMLIGK